MLTDLTHHLQLQGVIRQGLEGRVASWAASDITAVWGWDLSTWKPLSSPGRSAQVMQGSSDVGEAQDKHWESQHGLWQKHCHI